MRHIPGESTVQKDGISKQEGTYKRFHEAKSHRGGSSVIAKCSQPSKVVRIHVVQFRVNLCHDEGRAIPCGSRGISGSGSSGDDGVRIEGGAAERALA